MNRQKRKYLLKLLDAACVKIAAEYTTRPNGFYDGCKILDREVDLEFVFGLEKRYKKTGNVFFTVLKSRTFK